VPAPILPRQLRGDGLNLLFVGNLSARKGVPELLRAMALPSLATLPVTLTLAGGGALQEWRAMAAYLGVSRRVRFEGWADAPRLAQLLSQADALVLPSHDEGLPLAILEALAQGVPVVCTPVGEIPHQLQGGTHAFFVPPGDAPALSRGLARVLGDARLREALGRNGHDLWRRRFSLPRFFAEVAAVHARHFGLAGTLAPAGGAPVEAARP
jgi:glycosyltransferase involved in cell wall biosynthesis